MYKGHLCLVTELMGQNVSSFVCRFGDNRLPALAVKQIIRQVALALTYLHEECNIVHAGA